MPIVQAKCENCGGNLTVESSLKAANCPHCGAAYVVQDAISYFNSVTKIENLHADVVNINDENSAAGRLKAAESHMKVNEYDVAQEEFLKVTKLTPQDYKGWWGLLRCGVAKRRNNENEPGLDTLKGYAKYVEEFAPEDVRHELMELWNSYLNPETEKSNDINILKKKKLQEKNLTTRSNDLRSQLSLETEKANYKLFLKPWVKVLICIDAICFIPIIRIFMLGMKLNIWDILGFLMLPIISIILFGVLIGTIPMFSDNKRNRRNAMQKVQTIQEDIRVNNVNIEQIYRDIDFLESKIKRLNHTTKEFENSIITRQQ